MPQTEAWITMGCVGNEVGGPLVDTALWQGALLADVLRAARPRPGATQGGAQRRRLHRRLQADRTARPARCGGGAGSTVSGTSVPERPRALVGAERWGG